MDLRVGHSCSLCVCKCNVILHEYDKHDSVVTKRPRKFRGRLVGYAKETVVYRNFVSSLCPQHTVEGRVQKLD